VAALLVAGLAVWLGVRALDAERQRDLLLARLWALLDRPVSAAGTATFNLLPTPRIVVTDLSTSDGALKVARLEARLAVSGLLLGRAEVAGVAVRKVKVNLDHWEVPPGASMAGLPNVTAEDVAIEWSRLPTGQTLAFARATARPSEHGDFLAIVADAAIAQRQFRVEAGLGPLGAGGGPASVSLTLPGGVMARLAGSVTRGAADLRLAGRFDLQGRDAGALLGPAFRSAALRGEGQLELSANRLLLNDVRFALGEIGGSGAASYLSGAPDRYDLSLQLNRIDIGALLAGGLAIPIGSLLRDASADVDIGIAAASWGKGIVQQVKLELDLVPGAMSLRRASALLPGGSDISLSGRVTRDGGGERFDGRLKAGADNFRALLEWLGVDVRGVPGDRLRRGEIRTDLAIARSVANLTGIDLRLDSSRAGGVAAVALQARPSFSADLTFDRLNLDGYDIAALSGEPDAPLSLFTRFDSDLRLAIGTFTAAGLSAERLRLESRLLGGKLDLDRLEAADLAGMSAALSGSVNVAPSGAAVFELATDLHGGDLGRVLRQFGIPEPEGGLREVFSFAANVRGDPRRLAASDIRLSYGGHFILGDLELRRPGGAPPQIGGRLAAEPEAGEAMERIVGALPRFDTLDGAINVVGDGGRPLFAIEARSGALSVTRAPEAR
jgi:hypothetical protein